MVYFKKELDKKYKSVGFTNKRKNLGTLEQVGTSDKERDSKRTALKPGKRISKNGKVYWETRKNRSDSMAGI
jgi:hypothetical protein